MKVKIPSYQVVISFLSEEGIDDDTCDKATYTEEEATAGETTTATW
jgi:hypothetical protein